ncbi:MAG TPA: Ldh family oxidoreductase [Bauldia sp.]|nr:Ldh family oxidoreductase [Bauldia sp.]
MLDNDQPDRIRLSAADATKLGKQALHRLGFSSDEAATITDHLVDNMLCGYAFAGLPRILAIASSPELKEPRKAPAVIHETPISALIDGGNNVGYISVLRGAEIAIEKARTSGVGIVGVHNSWFSGRNGYYLEKIGRAGFAALHTSSGIGLVVPPGATRPALGTNPMAFVLPRREHPFIFDMGTGATMWGEVLLKALLGEEFPEGTGLDSEGRPTRSAAEIAKGGVLPLAGHKGYGLSLTIQALGLIAGARLRRGDVLDYGFFFIAFEPGLLVPHDQFIDDFEEMITRLKALPRQPGVDEIRIPSERSFRERAIRQTEGVLLSRRVYDALHAF